MARPYLLSVSADEGCWVSVANLTVAPVPEIVHTYTAFDRAKVKHFFARFFCFFRFSGLTVDYGVFATKGFGARKSKPGRFLAIPKLITRIATIPVRRAPFSLGPIHVPFSA